MWKKWRGDKLLKYFDEFILSPLGYFSNEYGKITITVCVICICLITTRPMNNVIELPKAFEDTVGDIPIIEHWDDGSVEVFNNRSGMRYGGWGSGMISGYTMVSSDIIFVGGY